MYWLVTKTLLFPGGAHCRLQNLVAVVDIHKRDGHGSDPRVDKLLCERSYPAEKTRHRRRSRLSHRPMPESAPVTLVTLNDRTTYPIEVSRRSNRTVGNSRSTVSAVSIRRSVVDHQDFRLRLLLHKGDKSSPEIILSIFARDHDRNCEVVHCPSSIRGS